MSEKTTAEIFGDGATPRNTREKILFAALDLFLTYGVHAVGIDRIFGDVGVTKTTFYNHFPSKDDLVVEALAVRDQWELNTLMAQLHERAGYDPKGMLLAIFDVLDDWFRHEDFRGCIFINTCSEFPAPTSPIHRAAAQHKKNLLTKIIQMARGANVDDPEALASEWAILLDGAVTHRLVSGDDHIANTARRIAERVLNDRIPRGSVD